MGARGKYNVERHAKIIALIKKGNYLKTAAQAVGIDESTFTRWMQEGEREQAEYEKMVEEGRIQENEELDGHKFRQFFVDVGEAKAIAEATDLARIEKVADTTWQAAAWRLERRYPRRWAKRSSLRVGGEGEGNVMIVVRTFDDDPGHAISNNDKALTESKCPELPRSPNFINAEFSHKKESMADLD